MVTVAHLSDYRSAETASARLLLKSLETADAPEVHDIENALTTLGHKVVPLLLKGLFSTHPTVKGVSAMVLIRLNAVDQIQAFYELNSADETVNWVARFILAELGAPLPVAVLEHAI